MSCEFESVKDPQAKLDYGFSWLKWMDPGDAIVTSTWAISGKDSVLIETTPAPTHDGINTTVWLSGGTPKVVYTVTNHIVTSEGRIDERSFTVFVKNL